jgi:hypothetical protein
MTREEKIERMVQQMINEGTTTDKKQARKAVLQELDKPGGGEWLDKSIRRGTAVKLVDVEKYQKKSKEPKQGYKKLKGKVPKIHSGPNTAKDLGGLGKKIEEAAKIAFGGKKTVEQPTTGELLEDIEGESETDPSFDFQNWWDEEPEEQTQEERLERQIEHFNNMRSHVSDLDEDYLLDDAPRDHWEQGLQSRPDEREMTQIVEALQRKAMQQGNVGATAQLPIGQFSNQGFPMTPVNQNLQGIIQALQNQNQMGSPGSDVNSLYDPYNARQTLRYGGGQQGYAHPGIQGGPSRFGGGGSNTPSYL